MKTALEIGNEILSSTTEAMDRSNSESFFHLSYGGDKPWLEDPDIKKVFEVQVMAARIKSYEIEVEDRVVVFLASIARNVAEAVMYVSVLWAMQIKNGRPVSWDNLVTSFPWGFPTVESMNTIWDGQKKSPEEMKDQDRNNWMDNDNWIDHTSAWIRPN